MHKKKYTKKKDKEGKKLYCIPFIRPIQFPCMEILSSLTKIPSSSSMAKQVEHDPQQYIEDWFDVAIPMGKEFELPNLSNIFTTSFSAPTLSFQNILIHANPPFAEIDAVSSTEIECAPFPRVVEATKPAATEEHQPYSSGSCANSYTANHPSLPITSHRFIALRNQQSVPRLIPTPRITSLNPPFYHSSQTIHVKHQETQFSGILKYASPCYSDSVVTFTTDRSAQRVENHLAGLNVGSDMTMSNYQQKPSILYNRIDQPILAANLDSLDQSNLNVPKYLSLPLVLMNTSLPSKAQEEIQLPNAHNLQPKQELLGSTALSSHFNSHLRRTQRSLSVAQTSRDRDHICFVCKASFINGNALGGHMSYHAKKRKIVASQRGQFFESGTASGFVDSSPGSQILEIYKNKTGYIKLSYNHEHKCFTCKVTFANGNALGGYTSSRAKKRKIGALRNAPCCGQVLLLQELEAYLQVQKIWLR
ncbi:hypothetical protein SADUNF_Sadunf01G0010000 [Salix dunnii]|uniref:C2H2-type domain-containing protein n=1 Tax=Salix dunnii TaxID=1413687 RepID=A0A835N933_9ROSI|nr:hypothetical protein SADUNF_Sadunf01G0010000 [Salix dunnii]